MTPTSRSAVEANNTCGAPNPDGPVWAGPITRKPPTAAYGRPQAATTAPATASDIARDSTAPTAASTSAKASPTIPGHSQGGPETITSTTPRPSRVQVTASAHRRVA